MLLMWGRKRTVALAFGSNKHWVFLIKAGISYYKMTFFIITEFLWNIVFKSVSHPWGEKKENHCYSPYIQQDNLECMIGYNSLIYKGLIHCWPNSFAVAKWVLFPSNQILLTWRFNLSASCTKAKKSFLLVRWLEDAWWEAWDFHKSETTWVKHTEPYLLRNPRKPSFMVFFFNSNFI